jgi:hypothetical protein
MAQDSSSLPTPLVSQRDPQPFPPPSSPSPSEPEEFILDTSTSRTPSHRPTEATSTSTSPPASSLATNPDYLALKSSLSLLNAQHRQVRTDMRTLLALKERALANPAWFQHVVVTGGLPKIVPEKQNVVRCPRVEWEKYGSLGLRLGRELEKPTPMDPFYTVSFDKSRLIQGVQIFPPLDSREEGSL